MTGDALRAGVAARAERVAAILEAYGSSAVNRGERAEAIKLAELVRATREYLLANGDVDDAILTIRTLARNPALADLAPWDPQTGSRRPLPDGER